MYPPVVFLLLSAALAVEAEVVRIEGPTFFVTLGHDDLVRVGDEVEVLRVVEVTDPSTGRTLSDRFSVGEAEIVEVGASLSLLRADPSTVQALRIGDVVVAPDNEPELILKPIVLVEPDEILSTDPSEVATIAADRRAFEEAFRRSSAIQDLAARQRIWQAFLDQFPDSELAPIVQAELKALDALAEDEKEDAPKAREIEAEDFILTMEATSAGQITQDTPLEVVVTIPEINRVTASRLYFRRSNEETWREAPLDRSGDTALRGEIPGDAIQPPGIVWFIAAQDYEHGEFRTSPHAVGVRPAAEPEDGVEDRSTVSLRYEFVDFYYLTGADRWQQAEGDFIYRIDRSILYSVGMGGGYYQGWSAPASIIDELDRDEVKDVRVAVGYKYAYGLLELRLSPMLAVQGRGVMGVQLGGFNVGAEGRLRIGRDEGTNLLLGGGFIPDIGQEFELALDFDAVPRMPMLAGVEVTNQPGLDVADLGVRLIYEARYELNDSVQVGGRLGYQLRNTNHSGPAFGATTVFSW